MDIMNAIKKPFTDGKKFLIGFLLGIIPIVNFIVVGYGLEVIRNTLGNSKKLPEWKNYGDKFVQGLLAAIIGALYAVPFGIVAAIFLGVPVMLQIISVAQTGMMDLSIFSGMGVILVLLAVIAVITVLLQRAAVVRYAEKKKFSSAFDFSVVFKKAFSGKFISAVIVSTIYGLVLGIVSLVFPKIFGMAFVISGLIGYLVVVTGNTLLAEGYKAAK